MATAINRKWINMAIRFIPRLATAITSLMLAGMFSSADALAQGVQRAGLCPAQLNGAIAPILNRPAVRNARWGVLVQTLSAYPDHRQTLFARNPSTLLIPASNSKLFTTAAALIRLGQHYQIRTPVMGDRESPTVETLRIIGRGDPSLTSAHLHRLAQQLSQKGIRQVNQLIGDDTYFRGDAINPNWKREHTLTGYGAAVNSLILNQNGVGLMLFPQRVGQPLRIQWDDPADASQWRVTNRSVTVPATGEEFVSAYRIGNQTAMLIEAQLRAGSEPESTSVSVPNPGNYLVQKFRAALEKAGIAVASATVVKTTPAPPGEIELAAVESPLLRELIIETNLESNNVYAEALLKTLGKVQSPDNGNATASGVAAVKAILAARGVNPNGYQMVDGSGLADRNRASAAALVQTLQTMTSAPEEAQAFRNTLAIAGDSGTLKRRFRHTPAERRVAAKTGYISGVVALSGYLSPPNYPPLVFSILVNQPDGSVSAMRSAVDDLVVALTRLREC
ncbi:D-alanyl-D-alanine carboxypeptidase/D-alanyl-D-alanine-endopeptidase [Leptothermofonsia sichuanensis E412]|uniref:D-alanyl-D-alanine carboxypeptidase/D-alanyl-D-alanine endopeptidase n=1 Tax=Leptothermofonsia sichuanensis TaxID=2917832 RepID=UPI001CA6CBCE|nr:D-alanyl-D-alanine carboxypeptidase/D-alanyl-D-alanine-endopeptidase [Leptothermofonsia sichuanensis]QZZ22977.1 D-alanyl-D-alanine carboxypeptidase/D-alanyl-D-alanine-endopeptidase [Leptothermofonsia sichuanensis E412]